VYNQERNCPRRHRTHDLDKNLQQTAIVAAMPFAFAALATLGLIMAPTPTPVVTRSSDISMMAKKPEPVKAVKVRPWLHSSAQAQLARSNP
jgi:hypothetical protein